jgi:hypothetical protein
MGGFSFLLWFLHRLCVVLVGSCKYKAAEHCGKVQKLAMKKGMDGKAAFPLLPLTNQSFNLSTTTSGR